jgi:hypothetical protein
MADYQQHPQQQHELWGEDGDGSGSGSGSGSGGNGRLATTPAGAGGVESSSSSSSSSPSTTNALTARVRSMPAGDFLDCLRLCFEQMLLPMERAALVHAFLEEQISVEISRLLDRRASRPHSASSSHTADGASQPPSSDRASPLSPLPPPSLPPPPSSPSSAPAPVPVPPASPPPTRKSDKFKSFLDKRRLETQGSGAGAAAGSGTQAGGGGGSSAVGAGGGGGRGGGGGGMGAGGGRGALRDEEQIKLLELQACKRLNDEILKALCDLCQRHVASLLGKTPTWCGWVDREKKGGVGGLKDITINNSAPCFANAHSPILTYVYTKTHTDQTNTSDAQGGAPAADIGGDEDAVGHYHGVFGRHGADFGRGGLRPQEHAAHAGRSGMSVDGWMDE